MYVGEASGENEEKQGEPFVGKAGWQLDSVFKRARIDRRTAGRFDNVLHCRPPGNELRGASYEGEAIRCCSHFLDETIEKMKPRVIVALGNTPLERLTGFSGIKRYRGFVLDGPGGIPVVATFHPSFLLPRRGEESSAKWTGVVVWDLKRAEDIARNGFVREPVRYLLDPPAHAALAFFDDYERALDQNPQLALAWDIETPGKLKKRDEEELSEIDFTIVRMSFAFEPRYAMSIPFLPPWYPVIEALLGHDGIKVGWNDRTFDRVVVRANGLPLNGTLYDGMDAWHVLQPSLPKKLEVVTSFYAPHMTPWKHLAKPEPEFYSACDADATICDWNGIRSALLAAPIPDYEEIAA